MTNKEAIETLEANYPDSKYTLLREAVDLSIQAFKKIDEIKAEKQEMLEALIKSEIMDEKLHGSNDFDNQKLIEKVTGKAWEEIKASKQ